MLGLQADTSTVDDICTLYNSAGQSSVCRCSASGECSACRQQCIPATEMVQNGRRLANGAHDHDTDDDTDVFRGCVEASTDDRPQMNCGKNKCTALCRLKCGGTGDYGPNQCNNNMGFQCTGVASVFNPTETFQGPCCECIADCDA